MSRYHDYDPSCCCIDCVWIRTNKPTKGTVSKDLPYKGFKAMTRVFEILSKYHDAEGCMFAEHDKVTLAADPQSVSKEDLDELHTLGVLVDEIENCFFILV